MRCAKSYKFWHIWTVLFHLWNGMDRCVKKKKNLFIPLSSLLLFFLSLSYFFSSFFHCLFLAPVTPSSLFLILSSPASSQWLRVLFLFFFLSLSLSFSFPVTKKKAILIWSRARWLKLTNLKLCSPIWSSARQGQSPIFAHRHPQLSSPMVGWVWSLIDLLGWGFVEDFEFFFFFWLRFLDLEFVERFGDCGCSLWRWLLVLGWWWLPLAVHLYICWVLGKYIILIFRIKE